MEEPGETLRNEAVSTPIIVNPEEATELWAGGDGDRSPGITAIAGMCSSLCRALRQHRHLLTPSPLGDIPGCCTEMELEEARARREAFAVAQAGARGATEQVVRNHVTLGMFLR